MLYACVYDLSTVNLPNTRIYHKLTFHYILIPDSFNKVNCKWYIQRLFRLTNHLSFFYHTYSVYSIMR